MADMTPVQRENCKKLWSTMDIGLDTYHEHIRVHQKATFLGYADITFGVKPTLLPGLTFKVRGVEVKLVNGKPMLGFPQELGSNGNWYPKCMPKSRELREVLTLAIFEDARIKAAIQKSAELPAETSADTSDAAATLTSGDNPFDGEVAA